MTGNGVHSQGNNYHLGLLHFAHLLVSVDGVIDEREQKAMRELQLEEQIPKEVFEEFTSTVTPKTQREVYQEGLNFLNQCTDQEKLCAFAQLYRLAEADDHVHVKEVRLLLYSLKATRVEFDDVIMAARMSSAVKTGKNFA